MKPDTPSRWIGILIDARLFELPEQESHAHAALRANGVRVLFASELAKKAEQRQLNGFQIDSFKPIQLNGFYHE